VRVDFIDSKIKTRLKAGYAACDRCNFGEQEIAVTAGGNIYPCERLVGEDTGDLCIGNVRDGFDATARMAVLAKRGNRNPECRDCGLRERCMNWCACTNYITTGAIDRVDGLVCYHEQMTVAIADSVAALLYEEQNPYFLETFYSDEKLETYAEPAEPAKEPHEAHAVAPTG
jgi:uncharacterized protein